MRVLPVRVKNQFWGLCGHNVMGLIDSIEKKRFEGTFDGDLINHDLLLATMSGMVREIERLQLELNDANKNKCGPECKCKVDPVSKEKTQDQPQEDIITD